MVKVTIANVTKLSEDSLYMALQELTETDPVYALIEAELDRRIEVEGVQLEKRHKAQLESLRLTQAIQSELQAIFNGFKGKKTMVLIEHLGGEFIDDYSIDEDSFTVYSRALQSFPNQTTTWEFETIEKARCKMAKLVYYRIYDKFMRDATQDNLELLKRVLGE